MEIRFGQANQQIYLRKGIICSLLFLVFFRFSFLFFGHLQHRLQSTQLCRHDPSHHWPWTLLAGGLCPLFCQGMERRKKEKKQRKEKKKKEGVFLSLYFSHFLFLDCFSLFIVSLWLFDWGMAFFHEFDLTLVKRILTHDYRTTYRYSPYSDRVQLDLIIHSFIWTIYILVQL